MIYCPECRRPHEGIKRNQIGAFDTTKCDDCYNLHYAKLAVGGIEIVPDPPDAWRKVAQCIDRVYKDSYSGHKSNQELWHYSYRGKRLDNMTYQECVTALAYFKIPCDDLCQTPKAR